MYNSNVLYAYYNTMTTKKKEAKVTKQDTDEYLTPDEACRYLGVTRRTLERYGEEGRLTKYKRGITRNVFYKKSVPFLMYLALAGLIVLVMTMGYVLWWMNKNHPEQVNAFGQFLFVSLYIFMILFEIAAVLLVVSLAVHVFNSATVVHKGDVVIIRTFKGIYHASARQVEAAHPREQYRYNIKAVEPAQVVESEQPKGLPSPRLALPGPCDFADILDDWRPSQQQILLALGPGGERVTVPVKALCHVALAGATGGGKSNLMRLLLPQLLCVGARVILADPHYTPVDVESDEDWRPIARRLMMEPAIMYPAIKDVLSWLALKELPSRLERRRDMEPMGDPIFLAIDELPAIVKRIPEAPEYMADLLREGRKVGLYLVSAAQDWLVKTVGGTGAVRDCFRTAFYVGGDATSARVLLDVKGTVDDGGLGKGLVMLRSQATPQASLIRVPYASNDALEELLTIYPHVKTTDFSRTEMPDFAAFSTDSTTDSVEIPIERPISARATRVRELLREKTPTSKIIEEVWGVTTKQGGAPYKKAAHELSEIIAELF